MCNGGQQVDAAQVKPHSPDLKDTLATDASGCGHLDSSLEGAPPMQEFRSSRPASEQPRESHYICIIFCV